MLRTYGPGCEGRIIDAKTQRIPDQATWIDLEEPTREEDKLVEECIQVEVPTQAEMSEIEPSSRLYEENGALYMTISALRPRRKPPDDDAYRIRSGQQSAGDGSICHAQADSDVREPCATRS